MFFRHRVVIVLTNMYRICHAKLVQLWHLRNTNGRFLANVNVCRERILCTISNVHMAGLSMNVKHDRIFRRRERSGAARECAWDPFFEHANFLQASSVQSRRPAAAQNPPGRVAKRLPPSGTPHRLQAFRFACFLAHSAKRRRRFYQA